MEEEIICNNCGWTGDSTMLECSDEDYNNENPKKDIIFNLCPDCESNDIEDIEN